MLVTSTALFFCILHYDRCYLTEAKLTVAANWVKRSRCRKEASIQEQLCHKKQQQQQQHKHNTRSEVLI